MLSYFLLAIGLLLALVLGLGYFAKADPKKLARALRYIGGIALLGIALMLVARGLMIYAAPLAVLGYALLQGRMPFSTSMPGTAGRSTGQQSRVRTATIEMRLDHDSGDMEGLVLKGKFSNRMLSDLELADLLELWAECRRSDDQAAKLLEAYIDRTHPEWRDLAGEKAEEEGQAGSEGDGQSGPMSVEEAYEILGLKPGASASDIRQAHRNLMKKLHPDQGGSTYLASKINEAKDLLLKKR
jgi:hypothetical protein